LPPLLRPYPIEIHAGLSDDVSQFDQDGMPGFRMCVFEIASDIPCNDKIGDRLKQRVWMDSLTAFWTGRVLKYPVAE